MTSSTRAAWILFVGCTSVGMINIVNFSDALLTANSDKDRLSFFAAAMLQLFVVFVTAKTVVKSEALDESR